MNSFAPKFIALQFNEYINYQDIFGPTSLMTEDHSFIDWIGKTVSGKEQMTTDWIHIFELFPGNQSYLE